MRRASFHAVRCAGMLLAVLLLAACAGHAKKPAQATTQAPSSPSSSHANSNVRKPWKPLGPYTPGGLYAPDVADGAPDIPPDVANLPEPVPHAEPLSRYGNRSPYVVLGKSYTVLPSAKGYVERGLASWYGTKFDGRVTSSLEPYDINQFSAAHRTLPLPSFARVTNLENGRSVIVRVNDRGPFHDGRLIDLSYAAAIKLGVNVHGTAQVEVRGIDTGAPDRSDAALNVPIINAPARAVPSTPTVGPMIGPAIIAPTTRGFLQLASYTDRGNAERMLKRLLDASIKNAELVSVQVGGQTLWRVHVGPFSADEAERVAEQLDTLGFGHPPFFKN
ncbi:MAG: septal ring lytic transglycosylase RlpA family protein [Lysobacteraceae bacterium]